MGKYQSGQMGQTVNMLAYAFGGSNPSLPTIIQSVKRFRSFDALCLYKDATRLAMISSQQTLP